MKKRDHRDEEKLPVTGEIGGEGGSYGDGAVQAETFTGAFGNKRVDPKRVGPAGGDAAAVAAEGEPVRAPDEPVKHATEPPDSKR